VWWRVMAGIIDSDRAWRGESDSSDNVNNEE